MKLKFGRILSLVTASAMIAAALTACVNNSKEQSANRMLSPEKLKTAEYPLQTDEELTIWMRNHIGAQVQGYSDYSQYPRVKEIEEKTGIKLKIIYADNGQEEDQFNLLLASGDLPDLIYYDWMHLPGGADEAIRSGYITELNDLIADYAPNYCSFLEKKPEFAKMARTDSGKYYMFNNYPANEQEITDDLERAATCGLTLRKDWLEELSLAPPETISEWYNVLKAFKEQKNTETPICFNFSDEYAYQNLIGAFGISPGFYQKNGKVMYGRAQTQYKDFLVEMRKWYTEGLLDEAIMSVSDARVTEKMVDGSCGAGFAWIGAGIERWLNDGKKSDPDFDIIAVKPPTLEKGETSKFGNYFLPFSHNGIAVSATSDKKELAVKFLDYGYSDEGAILYNYGIEGISYEMIDGKPVYKEPPDGMTRTDFLTLYTMITGSWPCKVLTTTREYLYSLPQQLQAIEAYKQTEYYNYILPPISQTSDEAEETSRLERLIVNYADEMMKKFILGKEPIENFDLYISELQRLRIDRLMELKQAALDRYNRR